MEEDKERIPHAADCCYQAAVFSNEQRNHVLKWKQHADKKEPNQFKEHLCACITTKTKIIKISDSAWFCSAYIDS